MNRNLNIIRKILKGLATGTAITLILFSSRVAKRIIRDIKHELKDKNLKKKYLMRKFYYLRERELVSFVEKGDEIEIVITEKGRRSVLKYDIEMMKIDRPKRWDGKWRLVFFDIPESKKKARDALVFKLRDLGFVKFNNSVWVFPYECRKEVDFISEFFDVAKYVHYAVASDITNEQALMSVFKI